MQIPNTCKCLWCNGTMERKGATILGPGLNTFSLWCTNCNAVVIHVNHTSKQFLELNTEVKYKENT